jgi:hypothetical protein
MLLGIATGMSLFFICCRSPQKTWSTFSRQIEYSKLFRWGSSCLPRHTRELSNYIKDITRPLRTHRACITFLVCSLLTLGSEDKQATGLILAGLLMATAALGWRFNTPALEQPSLQTNPHHTIGIALLIILGVTAMSIINMSTDVIAQGHIHLSWNTLVILGYLFFIPAIGAIGTSNDIYDNFAFQIVGWQAILFSCFAVVGSIFAMPLLLPLCGTMTSIIIGCIGEYGNQYKSYRLHGSLAQQTVPVTIGYPGTKIYFEPMTAACFQLMKEIFTENGFKPGDDILGLFDVPGFVHAMGGVSPGHQWHYARGYPEEMLEVTYQHLAQVPTERLQKSFLIQRDSIESFQHYLQKLELSIPQDYVFAGNLFWPHSKEMITIWKPIQTVTAIDTISLVKKTLIHEITITNEPQRSELMSFLETSRYEPTYQRILEDTLLRQHRFAEAAVLLEYHLQKDRTNLEVLLNLLTAHIAEKKVHDALAIIDQIVAVNPNIPEVLETRSFLLSQTMV